jgi:hypothetical protein
VGVGGPRAQGPLPDLAPLAHLPTEKVWLLVISLMNMASMPYVVLVKYRVQRRHPGPLLEARRAMCYPVGWFACMQTKGTPMIEHVLVSLASSSSRQAGGGHLAGHVSLSLSWDSARLAARWIRTW